MDKLRLTGALLIVCASILGLAACGGGHPISSEAPAQHGATPAYVALGDSVAAGAGLNPHPANNCNRSAAAYPNLVAAMLKERVVNLACAGATVSAGIEGGEDAYAPQLDELFALGKPKLITITIGANDINYSSAILHCAQTHCTALTLPLAAAAAEATLRSQIAGILAKIKGHYGNEPPLVVLTGYYQLFAASRNCAVDAGVDPTALAASADVVVTTLDGAIQAGASPYAFARFAPVDFTGHQLCTAAPWIQGPQDRAPYHPTAAGQAAFAAAVVAAVRGAGAAP